MGEFSEEPSLGIAYLAAVMEKNGFTAEVLDANLYNYGVNKTINILKGKRLDVICLSLYAFNFNTGIVLAEEVKKLTPGTFILAGGAHPSALMERTLDKGRGIDAVVAGEGEMTLLEIVQRLKENQDPFSGVDGVLYRSGDTAVTNEPRDRIDHLDTLPFPAFHLYPDLSRYRRRTMGSPSAPILTSRGCPFGCIFCSKSVFGNKVRYRSTKNVIAEIDYLVERFNVKQIDIVDDNFIMNRERAVHILESLCEKPYCLAINLQSGVRTGLVDNNLLKIMKRAGVYRIAFGIESGNQDVLDCVKKKQKLEEVVQAVSLTKNAGIRADGFFMIGLPGDSPRTMQDTIDFSKKLNLGTAHFHMVVPFPGTELYSLIKENGRFLKATEDGITTGFNCPEAFYEIGGLKKADIERYYKKAYREFFFAPKKMIQIILSLRSIKEFVWLFKTGVFVVFSMLKKRHT